MTNKFHNVRRQNSINIHLKINKTYNRLVIRPELKSVYKLLVYPFDGQFHKIKYNQTDDKYCSKP